MASWRPVEWARTSFFRAKSYEHIFSKNSATFWESDSLFLKVTVQNFPQAISELAEYEISPIRVREIARLRSFGDQNCPGTIRSEFGDDIMAIRAL